MALVAIYNDDEPILRLHYDTDVLLSARSLGLIFDRLSVAFEQYARSRGRGWGGASLAVSRVEVGSLFADLLAIGSALETLEDKREVLGGFVTHIADIVGTLTGIRYGRVKASDKKAVEAMYAPVASDQAVQVNVYVVGSDNHVVLNGDVIGQILAEQDRKLAITDSAHVESYGAANMQVALPQHIAKGVFGTSFLVDEQWYVRLEGQQGVMNPADRAPGIMLEHGRAYLFKGEWSGRRYFLRSADAL